ncbi:MAG: hypothetical protein O3B84_06040, partial [Chloroflexi bacterium]|nr:hypothetical protein [Chloroflexota bacterium]
RPLSRIDSPWHRTSGIPINCSLHYALVSGLRQGGIADATLGLLRWPHSPQRGLRRWGSRRLGGDT